MEYNSSQKREEGSNNTIPNYVGDTKHWDEITLKRSVNLALMENRITYLLQLRRDYKDKAFEIHNKTIKKRREMTNTRFDTIIRKKGRLENLIEKYPQSSRISKRKIRLTKQDNKFYRLKNNQNLEILKLIQQSHDCDKEADKIYEHIEYLRETRNNYIVHISDNFCDHRVLQKSNVYKNLVKSGKYTSPETNETYFEDRFNELLLKDLQLGIDDDTESWDDGSTYSEGEVNSVSEKNDIISVKFAPKEVIDLTCHEKLRFFDLTGSPGNHSPDIRNLSEKTEEINDEPNTQELLSPFENDGEPDNTVIEEVESVEMVEVPYGEQPTQEYQDSDEEELH